jgi:two-component system, cell cycle response regulator DivK
LSISIVADFCTVPGAICIKTALSAVGTNREFARRMRPPREACLLLDYGSVRSMPIGDRKTLDHYRNRLLRRAEAIQRRLDEVTRAARTGLVSIKDEIRALDSIRETLAEDGEHRANIVDRKSVRVTKNLKTVLIVEKNPNYTQTLVKQILLAGLKPIVAITGEGGLRMAEECHPDLILFEVELPDMNGLRFVSAIRRNPEADGTPIVAMSAFPDLKPRCLERGCNDFLLKPVKMIDLIARIRKFLH